MVGKLSRGANRVTGRDDGGALQARRKVAQAKQTHGASGAGGEVGADVAADTTLSDGMDWLPGGMLRGA